MPSNGKSTPAPTAISAVETGVVDPAIQEPPYHRLHIETAKLTEAKGLLEAALPKVCEAK